jgi:hypothetical protein
MDDVYVPLVNHEGKEPGWQLRASFAAPLGAAAAALLLGFSFFVTYTEEKATDDHVNQYYMWWVPSVIQPTDPV